MHCIVMSSPQNNASKGSAGWHIHRSVELLAYHHVAKRVRILFMVLAENRVDGPNVLRFLHRGNVDCYLVTPSYPMPLHPDEQCEGNSGILESVYRKAFKDSKACVREQALTPWEAWERVAHQSVTLFGGFDPGRKKLPTVFPVPSDASYVPFCVWELAPFDQKGFYLIAFSLEFSGQTYERLLAGDDDTFSVDGPQRLLSAIRYRDLMSYRGERDQWLSRLSEFENQDTAVNSDNYDVILIEPPLADAVYVRSDRCSNGIHRSAKHQPAPSCHAVRYVTSDRSFTLPLSYETKEAPLTVAVG